MARFYTENLGGMKMAKLVDSKETIAVLQKTNFQFKKQFGQNFLIDSSVLEHILSFSEINKDDLVIEIGPGIGTLTEALCERAGFVVAIEIDDKLIPILEETLSSKDNFKLIHGDALKVDYLSLLAEHKEFSSIKVVANLPYYITTPILMHLIESKIPFQEFVVMMQKEVADRISAEPNTKAYGSLSIAVQYYMTAKVAFIVPRTVFVPAPNVDSAILKMVRREEAAVEVKDEDFFFSVSKASFVHRRKTLWNNLTSRFGKTEEVKAKLEAGIQAAGLKPSVRGEALSLEDFARLADGLLEAGIK